METQTLPKPNRDERTLALLAHMLVLLIWFIGPFVIYLVKRNSRFVAFHALQALFWQLACFLLMMVGVGLSFAVAGVGNMRSAPVAFFFSFFLTWLVIVAVGVLTLVLGIVYGIKASKGEWAAYPVVGGWARRLAGV